ncbi:MAG TPA: DUF423 domain-containing protein [Xanthobacteraceae bacterium]|nr:DUF423 domain-containing protein [Xanthobacteraceae bacterium]
MILTLMICAGLMGAAGVALLAASAHAAPGATLDTAGQVLLFHAAAVLALLGLAGQGWFSARALTPFAAAGLVIGASLFAGDIAARAFLGHRLFPMAAPAGGVIMILSWLMVAVAGVVAALR